MDADVILAEEDFVVFVSNIDFSVQSLVAQYETRSLFDNASYGHGLEFDILERVTTIW